MAIFEKRQKQNVILDDTEVITCDIETAQKVNGHTEYILRVQRGPFKENSWKLLRRYNDFVELNKSLQKSGVSLPMPGKKLIGNMRPDFIAERRYALQKYINAVLMNPILASSLPAKKFVDPDSYSSSFHDKAVQNASICLRTEGLYVLGQSMGPIGWRLRKNFFKVVPKPPGHSGNKYLVKSNSQSHSKHANVITTTSSNANTGPSASTSSLSSSSSTSSTNTTTTTTAGSDISSSFGDLTLTWTEYGPDKYIDDKEINSILKSFVSLQHPYIEPIRYAVANEYGCLVIRRFYKHGSLKDMICMSSPKNQFLAKYGNPKQRVALSLREVALYGKQLLEALKFLHSKGIPHGHIHSGNIIIVNNTIRLLEIENFILGVPSFYRPFYIQHSKLHLSEAIDVYCFGHVLFEMSMGYPLQESVTRQITDCPDSLKNLLEIILSKDACKIGLPTLNEVCEHKFFMEYCPQQSIDSLNNEQQSLSKAYLKLSVTAKEQLLSAAKKTETRLREEQKSVKNQKRLVRVQELMTSEEEKKKAKQKARHEHKQSKLKQQCSVQTQEETATSSNQHQHGLTRSDSTHSVTETHDTTVSSSVTTEVISSQKQPTQQESISESPNCGGSETVEDERTRSALLESICRFNRGSLRKVRSND